MDGSDLGYPFTVRPLSDDEGGGFLIEFPDLPGCMADGATIEEALREGADALRSWVATMREFGRAVPQPTWDSDRRYSGRWLMRVPRTLHRRLAERAKLEGVSLNALATAILAEGVGARDERRSAGRRGGDEAES
ncbi:MAG TPA: type II toxin-antitoxin system HicB family antitoxin [Geminicoccaceae bacterium]|jgi:antitoxin HicB|nr:type II toxin-antitoxin system HicB family antitoxin [Geminicoccaceae bacterium]